MRRSGARSRPARSSGAPVQNQFYGDRSGTLEDPFGHTWTVSTHVEDLRSDEIVQRAEQAMKEG